MSAGATLLIDADYLLTEYGRGDSGIKPGEDAGSVAYERTRATEDDDPAPIIRIPLGGPTLDELVTGIWDDLTRGAALCPMCETGTLQPVYGAHARPVMGRCNVCHTELT